VFLLPSLILGLVFALLLGGKPSRLLDLRLRHAWTVWGAVAVQIAIFSTFAARIPPEFHTPLHLASYGLLILFAVVNVRVFSLIPLLLGMLMNALAIAANGGRMPVSADAWEAAGLGDGSGLTNVRLGADRLGFLGDVFALPSAFPLANVFSVGDLFIGFGAIALIVGVSTNDGTDRPLVPARLLQPLAVPAFRRLAAGKLVSHLGDWLTLAALVGWVYEETASTAHVAALLLVRLAPPILGGGIAAALVDRLRKERLLVWIELARGAAVGGALAAILVENRPLAFAAVALSGMLAAVSAATVPALVPSLLDDERLPAANAALGIAQDAAMALGALAAGIVLSASTAVVALAADLGTFVVAAVLYWGIRGRPAPVVLEETGDDSGVRAGLRYLLRSPRLLVVIGVFGMATIATGLTNATLPRLLDEHLGLGTGGYGFGLAALAAGLTVGQAFVGFTRVGPGAGRWIGAGLAFMAAFFVALAFTQHVPTALLLLALIGLVDGTTDVLFDTIVQRDADPRYYGRIFSFSSVLMTTTMMGAVAAAPLVNKLGPPREVIFIAGVALLGASVIALVGTRRQQEPVFDVVEHVAEPPAELPEPGPVLQLVPKPFEPESEPEPEREQERPHRVVLRLGDGERVLVGVFESFEAARAEAQAVTRYVMSLGEDEWPFFGHRFIRPETIVSVDLAEEVALSERRSDSIGG
jgi:MFS family permease